MAKFDPFFSLECAWRNPRKGRDQILPSCNLEVNRLAAQHMEEAQPSDRKACRVVIQSCREQTCRQGCKMAKFDPFLSLDCARVEGRAHNPRKGRDQILQRSVAEL